MEQLSAVGQHVCVQIYFLERQHARSMQHMPTWGGGGGGAAGLSILLLRPARRFLCRLVLFWHVDVWGLA